MSRKDLICVVDGIIRCIEDNHIKKKDMDKFLLYMADACALTDMNFRYDIFFKYIGDRIEKQSNKQDT